MRSKLESLNIVKTAKKTSSSKLKKKSKTNNKAAIHESGPEQKKEKKILQDVSKKDSAPKKLKSAVSKHFVLKFLTFHLVFQKKSAQKKSLSKQERRLLKLKSKKHFETVTKILPLFELLRREDTEEQRRFEIIDEILKETRNKVVDLCFAHDTARIIECAIQHGTEVQRWNLFAELRGSLRLLAKSRYGKFILIKLLKYGTKEHRLEVFKLFRNHVARLVNHRIAAEVVDLLYNDYANAMQRGELVRELYGNVHALKLAQNHVCTLTGALELNPDKRNAILGNVNLLLTNLASKGLTKYSIVQHLLLEYLRIIPPETEQRPETMKIRPVSETDEPMDTDDIGDRPNITDTGLLSLLEVLVEGQIVPMLHTREGVRAALHVLWASPPRLRKQLVRGLKTCVSSVARNEHGHLFLIGVLDVVDDIVLLEKLLIKEILEDLQLFCVHPEARKVLLYALSPRDSRHFPPQLQSSLFHAGDTNPFTKKPLGVRAFELRCPGLRLLPRLLQLIDEKLIDVFVGDCSPGGRFVSEDRGRLVLLAEVLIRSAAHHLDRDKLLTSYRRINADTGVCETEVSAMSTAIAHDDLETVHRLRHNALSKIVQLLLVPDFVPMGISSTVSGQTTQRDRNEERIKRHKRAVTLAEQQIVSSGKPAFSAFESKSTPDESDEESSSHVLQPSCPTMPFIERPEGQLFLRRLLNDGKLYSDFTFGRLIMEHVAPSNLCAWTRCNRSCFILVSLYELGDRKICKRLRSTLSPCMTELSVSPLPGAKVLYKHLSGVSE
ncbi:hypothetical protein P879_00648 [Paragonimus westermani]|uniref:PUM-HD domain-containing protein n=1 Tax=Paragonimus westermani TaxID=34504 RepID=A0A8T0DZ80_9TREM|nr:hypothetical protein P879_00648 [Paragonimus westermani]